MQPLDSYFALPPRRDSKSATKSSAVSTSSASPSIAGPSRPKTPLSAFVRSHSSRPQPASNKLFVCSLTNFVDCFHPSRGRLRVGSEKWYEPEEYPEVTAFGQFSEAEELAGEVLAESVEHLILDLRFVVGEDEWDKNTEFGALEEEEELLSNGLPKTKGKRKVASTNSLSPNLPIALPKLYKITFVGSEYVEEFDTRARMVAEIIESVGRHVLDIEWVTSADQQTDSIMCCSTHFVHPLIVEAGNRTWGAEAIEQGLRDGGLRKLTIQGGFPIVNPGNSPEDGAVRRKVDQSFAFKDWVPWNGVATLCWSFQGAYTQATVISVLKHLFRYLDSTFVPACAILVLQHLPPAALQAISAPDARLLSRLGLDNKPRLVNLIEDLVHVESSPPLGVPQNLDELASQTPRVVDRLWLSGYEEPEDGDNDDRQRGIRRFKADILANEHGARVQSVLSAVHSASKGLSAAAFSPPVPVSRPMSRRSTQTSLLPTPDFLPAIEEQPVAESPKEDDNGTGLHAPMPPGNLPSLSNSPMSPVISLRSGSSSSLDTVNVDEQSTTSLGENGTLHLQPMTPGEIGADVGTTTKSSPARTITSALEEDNA